MSFRIAVLSLVLAPAVSWAEAPSLRLAVRAPRTPRQTQAQNDHGGVAEALPANGRLRIPVALGKADTAEIRLVENGQAVPFERKVVPPAVRNDLPWVELAPARALQVGATVIVFVAGVRSATYRVAPADVTPPEVASADVQSFEVDLPAQEHTWGLGRPARDEVLVSLRVVDEGAIRVRGMLLSRDGGPPVDSINTTVVASGVSASSLLVFPPGAVAKSGQLRLEAVDVAGNVGTSKPIELARPAPVSADASADPPRAPEPAPRPVGRGCG